MGKLYNEDLKNEFLDTYDNEETMEAYGYIFERIKSVEEFFNKDLYEFNLPQVEDALHKLEPKTLSVARMAGAVMGTYIQWAIEEKRIRSDNFNPIRTKAESKEWYRKFIDTNRKVFISLYELEDIEERIYNYQDKVISRLIFEGVGGVFASELLNLRKCDVEKEGENTLTLYDDRKGERTISVSPECIRLVRLALRSTEYKKTPKKEDGKIRNPILKLVDNDYVIKTVETNNENKGRADKFTIYRRIAMIANEFNMPKALTTKSVQRSGMIYMGYKLMKKQGKKEIDREILAEVSERFRVGKATVGYNYTMLEEFINKENIMQLYGI